MGPRRAKTWLRAKAGKAVEALEERSNEGYAVDLEHGARVRNGVQVARAERLQGVGAGEGALACERMLVRSGRHRTKGGG